MKTVCIYHSIDLDGWMSAAIVKYWFNKTYTDIHLEISDPDSSIDFIGYNYGQPIPDLSEYNQVIMCDISFPKEEMEKIHNKLCQWYKEKFIWIDHHISAINNNGNFYDGLRDTKFSACELTWKHFFPNEQMPEIVRLLGRYDCFGHKGTNEEQSVLEFQYGARRKISNYEDAYYFLKLTLDEYNKPNRPEYSQLNDIYEQGRSIYSYLCTEARQPYKNGFEIEFEEEEWVYNPNDILFHKRKFICINRERFNPINFGIDYHKDGYDGCACFYFDGINYNFSLYNDNGLVDCSVIAKKYGGGGHKGASGFRLNMEEFNTLISK